jgi:hypothetical protein
VGSGPQTGGFDGWRGASPGSAGGGSGGGKTLEAIYAFGLTDSMTDPNADNFFGLPDGNLRFPGYTTRGMHGFDAGVEFYQDRTKISLSSPPAYELISMAAQNSGIGGAGGGFFRIHELNDPSWNGLFTTLSLGWNVEDVIFSTDVTQGANHQGTEFGRRVWIPGGQTFNYPNGSTGDSMLHQRFLYNNSLSVMQQVESQSGYGGYEIVVNALQGNLTAQWVTHWNNYSGLAFAGPAWIVDVDGRFDHFNAHAALQPYQTTNDPVVGAWGWRFWCWDGIATLQDVMDITYAAQTINGKQIATLDTGAQGTEVFVTPAPVDIAVGSVGNALAPARAGYVFYPIRLWQLVSSVAGAFATNPTITYKSGGTTVLTSTAPTNVSFAAGGANQTTFFSSTSTATVLGANQALTFDVTIPATGVGLSYKCYFGVLGYWQPFP